MNVSTSVEQSSQHVASTSPRVTHTLEDGSKARSTESAEPFSIGPWVGKVLDNRPIPALPTCLMFGFLLSLAYLRVSFIILMLSIGSCWFLWATAEKTNFEISGKGNRWKDRVQAPIHEESPEETAEWM